MQLWLRLDDPESATANLALLDIAEGTTLADCLPVLAEIWQRSEGAHPAHDGGGVIRQDRPPGEASSPLFPVIPAVPANPGVAPPRVYADGSEVALSTLVGHPPLIHGVMLSGRACQTPAESAPASVQLRVVSGHGAGDVHDLPVGQHIIGRSSGCGIPLGDGSASRRHALLTVQTDQVTLADLGSTNGTWLGDRRLRAGPEPVSTGDAIRIGATRLAIRAAEPRHAPAPDAVPRGDGTTAVNRCPRTIPVTEPPRFRYPTAPEPPEARRPAAVTLVLPLLAAAALAVVFRSPIYLCFGLLGPLMAVGQFWSERRTGLHAYRRRQAEHLRMSTEVDTQLADALQADRRQRELAAPDLCQVVATARQRGTRLWERSRHDPDVLLARLGTGPVLSEITIEDPRPAAAATLSTGDPAARHPVLSDAPVCIRLSDGPTGVAGPRQLALAVVRSLLCQVAVWHSPRDVRIWLLTDAPVRLGDWTWAMLLPHTRPDVPEAGRPSQASGRERGSPLARIGTLGTASAQLHRRVQELEETLRGRLGDSGSRPAGRRDPASSPVDLVVLDGARRLRAVPGVPDLLLNGAGAGIHLLCLASDQGDLPAECTTTVSLSQDDHPAMVARRNEGNVAPLQPDLMTPATSLTLATALAPLRDETPNPAHEGLPARVSLIDILDLPTRDGVDALAAAVRRGWDEQPASTLAILGVGTTGPHSVDLRTDGPHVLVAGTTGAGKSELLRTLITSLAIRNRPDRLCFVLVDYKGGAAFDACAALPHTVGVVTDLDGALTERALVSLEAELRRRERALRAAGVGDIDAYHATAREEPLPRVVLVIDEFRALSEELPDFVTGLVRIAALGRSLGVHLVLATQRPGGVVTPDIRSNMNLRIALRVRDRIDSADVIDADDAAGVSAMTPGRAILRSGGGPLTLIQTALVSGTAAEPDDTTRPPVLRTVDPCHLGEPLPCHYPVREPEAGPSDLTRLVTATQLAAHQCVAVAPAPPWLPPLPSYLSAEDLTGCSPASEPGHPFTVPIGLLDLPDHQRQDRFQWDVVRGGHLIAIGSGRSGRTTLARTAAIGLAGRSCPCQLNLYIVDGTGELDDLSRLPHVGAVVRPGESALLRRLVARLHLEVEQRRHRHGGDGPRAVLVLDGWERLREQLERLDHGETLDQLLAVLRDGPSTGVSACSPATGVCSPVLSPLVPGTA